MNEIHVKVVTVRTTLNLHIEQSYVVSSQTVTRDKLRKALLYKKSKLNLLMTPDLLPTYPQHIDIMALYQILEHESCCCFQGWFSRVYLTEHRQTREEIVLKAINRKSVSAEEFLREFHNSYLLSAHKNVLTIYDVVFQVRCHTENKK